MEVGSRTAWGPSATRQCGDVLRLATEVADSDHELDLHTAVNVLSKDKPRLAGERVGLLTSAVVGVNAWLSPPGLRQSSGIPPAALFRGVASRIEQVEGDEGDG